MSPLPERRAPRKPLGKRTDAKPKRSRKAAEPEPERERTTRKKGGK